MMQKRRSPASRRRRPRSADITVAIPPRLFKALCDPNRIAILARLAEAGRPMTVGEAAGCCPVDLSVVSRHLATLRDAGVLETARRGKEVYYWVAAPSLVQTLRAIADAIEECCPPECCAPPPRNRDRGRRASRTGKETGP